MDHAREALQLLESKARADLDRDRLLSLGVVRLLEIIGEAAGRVPEEMRAQCPSIPWAAVVGLRNRLIHGYDAVDHDIVWEIIETDLPALIRELEVFLTTL